MHKYWVNYLLVNPLVLFISLVFTGTAMASEAINVSENAALGQVASVARLADVQPGDWAFQALQSLVERYGCIAGYPDTSFKGNRSMTRYEFAAGLNACLEQVNQILTSTTSEFARNEDLQTLQKLQQEFSDELETMRGRLDALDARTEILESKQFSTTTKLRGEIIFGVASAFGTDKAIDSDVQRQGAAKTPIDNNVIMADRVRLNLDTSFTGKDRLRVRLQARNVTPFNTAVTGTNMTRLGFDGNDNNNDVFAPVVSYRFPLGKSTLVHVGASGLEYVDEVPTLSNGFDSSGSGAISRFGRYNPIYRAAEGTGIIVNHKLGKKLTLTGGYLVPDGVANNPSANQGLFDGSYSALGQLTFQPSKNFNLALTYVNAYYTGGSGVAGSTGTGFANNPFAGARTSANSYSVAANYKLNSKASLTGWLGYANAEAKNGLQTGRGADIWNWAVQLGLPDLGKKGNFAGIVFGVPPHVTDSGFSSTTTVGGKTFPVLRENRDTSYHLEAFYKYKVNDNVAITPGFITIFNPEGNSHNPTSYVGVVRTTFTF